MNIEKITKIMKEYAPLSLKGWCVYIISMGAASLVCWMLQNITTSDVHVPLIFVLVVLVVALMTDGYFY